MITIVWCESCGYKSYGEFARGVILKHFLVSAEEINLKEGEMGVFKILLNDVVVFDKDKAQRFPETEDIITCFSSKLPHRSAL